MAIRSNARLRNDWRSEVLALRRAAVVGAHKVSVDPAAKDEQAPTDGLRRDRLPLTAAAVRI